MKSYSYDLRVRIYNYSLTHSIRETAKIFSVSPNTVFLLKKLFIETGSLEPRESSFDYPHLITLKGKIFLLLLLADEVDITLGDLCRRYENTFGISVSIGTMYNTLKYLNITYKKKSFSDPKKNSPEAQKQKEDYDEKLNKIEPKKRFYLDETGSCLNMTPLYGRSQKDARTYDKRPVSPGTRVNTVAILTEEGIKAQYNYTELLDAELFIRYLDFFVLPILTDGQTLIMDNHPVHKSEDVENYLNKKKVKFLFLPPYSPELNPIEETFSKIKQYIKKQKARTINILLDVIKEALNIITLNDIRGYFNHAAKF